MGRYLSLQWRLSSARMPVTIGIWTQPHSDNLVSQDLAPAIVGLELSPTLSETASQELNKRDNITAGVLALWLVPTKDGRSLVKFLLALALAASGVIVSVPLFAHHGNASYDSTKTVTVKGKGRGGRNSEYLLALAIALGGRPGIWAIACDTDGIDGTEDNAGAHLSPDSLARARALGIDPQAALHANDAWSVFAALGDLLITGPTRTNVNDFRAILVDSP